MSNLLERVLADQSIQSMGVRQGGMTVEDMVSVIKDIESIRRERIEDAHQVSTSMGELSRKVSELLEAAKGAKAEAEAARQEVRGKADRSDLTGFSTSYDIAGEVERCVAGRCLEMRKELLKVLEEDAEGEGEEWAEDDGKPHGKKGKGHRTGDDFVTCPTCRPRLMDSMLRHSDYVDAFLEKLQASQVDRLIENLTKAGYSVEKKKPEQLTQW